MSKRFLSVIIAISILSASLTLCVGSFPFVEEESVWLVELDAESKDIALDHIDKNFPNVDLLYTYDAAICGFSAVMSKNTAAKISSLPYVADVYLSSQFELSYETSSNNDATALTNIDVGTESIHNMGYRGEGTVAAVIDAGFDTDHPYFSISDNTKTALTRDSVFDIAKITLSSWNSIYVKDLDPYVNKKIPYAYDYATQNVAFNSVSPHGTHVAGIIAGENGIAPEAQLLLMNVGNKEGSVVYDYLLYAAFEDAVDLGADVINISLGSTAGFSSVSSTTAKNLVNLIDYALDNGVEVCCAAGNDGILGKESIYDKLYSIAYPLASNPDFGLIADPSSLIGALSVASSNSTLISVSEYIQVDEHNISLFSQPDSSDFFGSLTESGTSVYEYVRIPGIGESGDYIGLNLEGKIALVERGTVPFSDKVKNAKDAGAVGIIIYDNISSDSLTNMNIADNSFPALFIGRDDGIIMAQANSKTLKLITGQNIVISNTNGGKISSFSSWGMNADMLLKPDIAAIGTYVSSSVPGGLFKTMSGTSMASPQAAGATLLLKQYLKNANIPYTYLRSLIMSSAKQLTDSNGIEFSPRQQGAGQIDLNTAVRTPIIMYELDGDNGQISKNGAKLSLGEISSSFKLTFEIKNVSENSVSFYLSATCNSDDSFYSKDAGEYFISGSPLPLRNTSIQMTNGTGDEMCEYSDDFGYGTYIQLLPGQSKQITLSVFLDNDDIKKQKEIFSNGFFVEGYIKASFSDHGNNMTISMPYSGFCGDFVNLDMIDRDFYDCGLVSYIDGRVFMLGHNPSGGTVKSDDYAAISPDGNDRLDDIGILLNLVRNAVYAHATVSDKDGNIIASTGEAKLIVKAHESNGILFGSLSDYMWDGLDEQNKRFVYPDGQYFVNVYLLPDGEGAVEQKYVFPVYIDSEKPSLISHSVSDSGNILSLEVEDNHMISCVKVYEPDNVLSNNLKNTLLIEGKKRSSVSFDIINFDTEYVYVDIVDYAMNVNTFRIYLNS